jgi:hypothetical protein
MAKKKSIVRKPIEKLSEKEAVVLIEDSSSEEEDIDIPPPPKLERQNAKPSTSNKVPCDICGKEFSKGGFRMHRQSCEKKNKVVEDVEPPKPVKKEKKVKMVEPEPLDPEDKPLTMKQMKAFMEAQQKPAQQKPVRKKYTKKPKPAPTPPNSPEPPTTYNKPPPQMLFV